MRHPETPAAEKPRAQENPHRERMERFLARESLHELNSSLKRVFEFCDRQFPAEFNAATGDLILHPDDPRKDNPAWQHAVSEGNRYFMFLTRFDRNVLENALNQADDIEKSDKERIVSDYENFLLVLGEPELRPRVLAKMCYMDIGATEEEQIKTWPERQAFHRFLYEFYGAEKKNAVFESGDRKGEKMKLFLSMEGQADFFEACNEASGWGLPKKAFDDIRKEISVIRERMKAYEDRPLVAAVLTPFLDDIRDKDGKIVQSGMHRTFTTLGKLVAAGQEKSWRHEIYSNPTDENLRLLPGIDHMPGLKFEIFDFGANKHKSLVTVRNEHSPHAQILALLASSREWVSAMGGEEVPFGYIPGYQTHLPREYLGIPDYGPWAGVPHFYVNRDDREMELGIDWGGRDDNSTFRIPILL